MRGYEVFLCRDCTMSQLILLFSISKAIHHEKKTVRSFLSYSASNLTSVAYRQGNYVELVSVMASLLPFAEDDKNGTAMVKYSNFDLCTRHMIVWGLLVAI